MNKARWITLGLEIARLFAAAVAGALGSGVPAS